MYARNTYLGIFILMEFVKCISRREHNVGVHLVRPWREQNAGVHLVRKWCEQNAGVHLVRKWCEQNVGVHLVRPCVSKTLAFTSYAHNTYLGIFILR